MLKWLKGRKIRKIWNGVKLPEFDFAKADDKEKENYQEIAYNLSTDVVLKAEINRLKNKAGKSLMRNMWNDVQKSWHLGGLEYLEELERAFLARKVQMEKKIKK